MFKTTKTITTLTIKGGTLEFPPASTEPIVTGDVTFEGSFVPDRPTLVEPPMDYEEAEAPCRPWSQDATMLAAMLVIIPICGLAVWGILRLWL